MAVRGREVYTVHGTDYDIQATYFVVTDGEGMYVVEWNLPANVEVPADDEVAKTLVMPLMQHVARERHYQRQRITGTDGEVEIRWLAIVVLGPEQGNRVRVELAEVTASLEP